MEVNIHGGERGPRPRDRGAGRAPVAGVSRVVRMRVGSPLEARLPRSLYPIDARFAFIGYCGLFATTPADPGAAQDAKRPRGRAGNGPESQISVLSFEDCPLTIVD